MLSLILGTPEKSVPISKESAYVIIFGEGLLKTLVVATLLLLALVGCSASLEEPAIVTAPSPAITVHPISTATFQPIMTAPAPTETLAVVLSPTSEGEPAAEWKGIPIMPDALTGEGDEEGYVFTIRASSQQVQDYYQLELAARGWQSLAEENEGSTRVLVFIDTTSTMLTVRILTRGEEALVLLTK